MTGEKEESFFEEEQISIFNLEKRRKAALQRVEEIVKQRQKMERSNADLVKIYGEEAEKDANS